MARLAAGSIVVVDWRDALPREPNTLRPAVVVEDDELFDPAYPNVILVPLTDDHQLAIPSLSVRIEPSPRNRCPKPCWALGHAVTTTSKRRIRPTDGRIEAHELAARRRRIALAIGLSG